MEMWTLLVAAIAVAIALGQLWTGLKATKVQRVIELHRDLTTGEVGNARDRFTTLMWKHGERLAGRNVCHAPRWKEILTDVLGASGSRGELGVYPREDHIATAKDAEPMRDLYSVLWCFERIEAGRAGRALDQGMLKQLVASHAVWWDELTRHLTSENTRHLESLRRLSAALEDAELRAWARNDFLESDVR
jgi:hypothetical protein